MSLLKKVMLIVVICLLGILAFTAYEFIQKDKLEKIPSRPEESLNLAIDSVLFKIERGEELTNDDFIIINDSSRYADGRYDCSDFRLITLIRLLIEHPDKLNDESKVKMKETFLNFKYWMDQGGQDSMCYWSENHQILFATLEYLAGQMYPNEIFTNDERTGLEHQKIAEERILIWLEQRWQYGFTEWYSNTYYVEDLAPLANLIDFAESEEIKIKASIIVDLLLYDVATQSFEGNFVSTSGRMYYDGKIAGESAGMTTVVESIWDFEVGETREKLESSFLFVDNYEIPEVIREIGYDKGVIIKASNGLNLSEYVEEGLIGTNLDRVMMQWASEAFSNPEVIYDTMTYIRENDMLRNEDLHDFKMIDLSILRFKPLAVLVSKTLNPVTNGVAIERANTYTYKTKDYMLATAQQYHPGDFGDQQHIWTATIANDLSVFTTHPSRPLPEDGKVSGSPNYWVGNGRDPHSVQDENINMSLYKIGDKKGFMEKHLLHFTHAYFPKEKFDEVILEDNYIFGRRDNALIAMIGKNDLYYEDEPATDLIQEGETTYWITEMSSLEDETFTDFIKRIKNNKVIFNEDDLILDYISNDKKMTIEYQESFKINEAIVNTEYDRFDSKYSKAKRKADEITIEFNNKSLLLDFNNLIRKVNN